MKQVWTCTGAATLALLTAPAAAQTAPPAPITVTGGATLVTDYRFRGLSQTDRSVAVQATATVQHRSGFYVSFWGSSIDDYVANGSDAELDLIGGYRKTFGGTAVDGGVLYYVYPHNGGAKTDFFEPYLSLSHTIGPVSAKLGGNVAWKQRGLGLTGDRRRGEYLYGELSAGIPTTPATLTGHLGHSFERNYITFGERYTDWSVTAAVVVKQVTLGVAYVDTNKRLFSYPAGGGHNKDVAKGAVVGSVGFSF
ncbi:TorF family putative porin [Sphingomonas bacterium]|uniref:TorF family putative porin n=1 Tax=Sphingomonas bacterium TaxID=1895847 RepID=UPI001575BE3E|nr:TorF family putative porin [Sphingomonas bacterium]